MCENICSRITMFVSSQITCLQLMWQFCIYMGFTSGQQYFRTLSCDYRLIDKVGKKASYNMSVMAQSIIRMKTSSHARSITVDSRYLEVLGTIFYNFKYPEVQILQRQIMVGKSNQNVFLIQINASSFAEFEISEFEIARVDCRSDRVRESSILGLI